MSDKIKPFLSRAEPAGGEESGVKPKGVLAGSIFLNTASWPAGGAEGAAREAPNFLDFVAEISDGYAPDIDFHFLGGFLDNAALDFPAVFQIEGLGGNRQNKK